MTSGAARFPKSGPPLSPKEGDAPMKNKTKVPSKQAIPKEVLPPSPQLQARELADFLEQCHKKNALKTDELVDVIEQFHEENSVFSNLLADLLPMLLLVEETLQDESLENFLVRLPDRDINYSSPGLAAAHIMAMISGRIFEAINGPETWAPYLESAVDSYREAHPKAV
jgi:hypothetical protein